MVSLELVDEAALGKFGEKLGSFVEGGERIELIGDIGVGKTTLTKAIAVGMKIEQVVSSPSYAISQIYDSLTGIKLIHYDLYRLNELGVVGAELEEELTDSKSVVVVEWGGLANDILPADRLRIEITPLNNFSRKLYLTAGGEKHKLLMSKLL